MLFQDNTGDGNLRAQNAGCFDPDSTSAASQDYIDSKLCGNA